MRVLNFEQGSAEWLEARKGVVTGTRLGDVMGTALARENLICDLIYEKLGPPGEDRKTGAMMRGTLLEDVAKEFFPEIEEVGFILHDRFDWLGISPDGISKNPDGKITKAYEFKCPEGRNFVKYLWKGGIPKEYYWQVVQYFLVIETLEELEFVVFNPDIYAKGLRLYTFKVTRKDLEESLKDAELKLQTFHAEWKKATEVVISRAKPLE